MFMILNIDLGYDPVLMFSFFQVSVKVVSQNEFYFAQKMQFVLWTTTFYGFPDVFMFIFRTVALVCSGCNLC